jgi:hypothetical protein
MMMCGTNFVMTSIFIHIRHVFKKKHCVGMLVHTVIINVGSVQSADSVPMCHVLLACPDSSAAKICLSTKRKPDMEDEDEF